MIAQRISNAFDVEVRRLGEASIAQIETWAANPTAAQAVVGGEGDVDYIVEIDRDGGRLTVSCTCPRFEHSSNGCEHVWALLRHLDNEDAVTVDGADRIAFDSGQPQWAPIVQTRTSGTPWQTFITELERRPAQHRAPPLPSANSELIYVVDVAASRDKLVVVTMTREVKRNGTTTKPQQVTIEVWQVAELPRDDDRGIMGILTALNRSGGPRSRFELTREVAEVLLPRLSATQRFFARAPTLDRGKEDTEHLVFDEKRQLKRRLRIEADVTAYVMRVQFAVGRTQVNPTFLVGRSYAYVNGAMLRVADVKGALVEAVQARGDVIIPFNERRQLSRALHVYGPEHFDAPTELELRVQSGKPTPMLYIDAHTHGQLMAKVSFRYGGTNLPVGGGGEVFMDDDRVIRRDRDAENAALAALAEVFGTWDGRDSAVIVARQLPAVVQRLGDAGFAILANGKRPRLARDLKVHVSSGVDWFELDGGAAFHSDGQSVVASLQKVVEAIAERSPFVLLDDGTLGLVPEEWLTKYHALTRAVALADDGLRFTRERAAVLDAVLQLVDEVSVDAAFAKARRELRKLDGAKVVKASKKFVGELRPYQAEGLGWLTALDRFDLHGCLADEMGLGKTVQVLAWIATRKRRGPVLVVAPRSVVHNWVDEARKFTPSLSVAAHVESDRAKTPAELAAVDIIITSYGTMVRDIGLLSQQSFDVAILDEAQVIKNANTVTARAARSLIATRRLALSGTPIENHLGELWSIFEFLSPGLLGTTKFQQLLDADARRPDPGTRGLIAAAMRPFILRRTKAEVTPDLPDKQEQTIMVDLTEQQRVIYDAMLTTYREALFAKVDEGGFAGSTTHILEALLRLRQAACHPALISDDLADADSAKLDALFDMISDVAESQGKVLVFSQFTSLLELVRKRLTSLGIVPAYLDGQTKNRAAVVQKFQEDEATRLMLVSLKAGGTGLNLTAADYVFMLDPWWNPAAEAQAIDRAHRIGRTRPVFAYKLVARDTIEERILDLQRDKSALADSILGGKSSQLKGMTRADLEALFR